jgi:hypothetical protein
MNGSQTIERWPSYSRQAAQLVIDKDGEPDEATDGSVIVERTAGEGSARCLTGAKTAKETRDTPTSCRRLGALERLTPMEYRQQDRQLILRIRHRQDRPHRSAVRALTHAGYAGGVG